MVQHEQMGISSQMIENKKGVKKEMSMLRKSLLLMLILGLAFAGIPAPTEAAERQIVIAACMQGNQSGFVRYMTSGMYEYQKANAPDIRLEVVFADDDPTRQQSQVENFVARGVDAIILNPVDKVQSVPAVDFAAAAGIPVITINTTSDSPNVTAHVGSDDFEAGTLQMERLLSVAPADAKVAYIDAVLGHSAQVFRAQGYQAVLSEHPNVELVVNDTANWSGEEALRLVENWLQAYPRIDVIAAHADCILVGAITAVENAGMAGSILLGGMDCDMPVLEKIKEGVVDNSIWQDGLAQGENSLRLAIDAANGVAVSDFIIPYEVCTAENVDMYIEMAEARNDLANQYF